MIQVHADSFWSFRMMKYAYNERVYYPPSLFSEDVDTLVYSSLTEKLGHAILTTNSS